ncbi:hypothetical protein [Rhabdothermincola sediminis]|uniref:hypothetical protein n=1 Tax=Rhabdothermincola sediminis TaxID=2751370 RepID=UPI001AA0695C|nr:hypothetical protein [Rhabdothermincola sediminis]
MSAASLPRTDRRSFLRRAAVVGGAAWVAPQVVTVPAGAAPVTWYVELDLDGNAVLTTASTIGCDPAGWVDGLLPPINGVDLNWSIVFNNGFDASQGMQATFSDIGAVIVDASAEETCAGSSPPGAVRCVPGDIGPVNVVDFPDMTVPESCVYDVFRIVLQTGS